MNINDIVKTLDGTLVAGGDSDRTVGTVVANDLMSDVLLNDGDDILLQVRTAINGARNFHDANDETFHIIRDFRSLLKQAEGSSQG